MMVAKVTLHGATACGKTSLLDLMFGKPPPEQSVYVTDSPARPIAKGIVSVKKPHWQKIGLEGLFTGVCQLLKKLIDEGKVKVPESSTTTPELEQSFSEMFARFLEEIPQVTASSELFDTHLVFITESGGQPHFHDAAPLFMRNYSLNCIVMRHFERLDEKPDFVYTVKGRKVRISDSELQLTNLQLILTTAWGITCIRPKRECTPLCKNVHNEAKFMTVGTFRDRGGECAGQTIKDKNNFLEDKLHDYIHFRIDDADNVILSVNTIVSEEATRKKYMDRFRKKITNTVGPTEKVEIPIGWLALLMHILFTAEKQGKSVVELSSCMDAGKALRMDKQETLLALQFFHELGLALHFPTKRLFNTVFVNVMPILDKLTLLLGITFFDRETLDAVLGPDFPHHTKHLLRHHGRFNKEMLEVFFEFTTPITADVFLDILEYLKIIIPVPKFGSGEFFIPCALAYASEEEISEMHHVSPFPWVIRLKSPHGTVDLHIPLPTGMFTSIILNLMTAYNFELDQPSRQYRNAMSLVYPGGGHLYLIDDELQLELYYSEAETRPDHLYAIRTAMLDSIALAEEKLLFAPGIIHREDNFICTCNYYEGRHVCLYIKGSHKAQCDINKNAVDLDEPNKPWLKATRKCHMEYTHKTHTLYVDVYMYMCRCNSWLTTPTDRLCNTALVLYICVGNVHQIS